MDKSEGMAQHELPGVVQSPVVQNNRRVCADVRDSSRTE